MPSTDKLIRSFVDGELGDLLVAKYRCSICRLEEMRDSEFLLTFRNSIPVPTKKDLEETIAKSYGRIGYAVRCIEDWSLTGFDIEVSCHTSIDHAFRIAVAIYPAETRDGSTHVKITCRIMQPVSARRHASLAAA